MQIQSVNNLNFGKVADYTKTLGRGHKTRTLIPDGGKASKLDRSYKSQIEQTYNSLSGENLIDELSNVCDGFLDKTSSIKRKFLPKK